MTNTSPDLSNARVWRAVATLRPGDVDLSRPERGPIAATPEPIGCIDWVPFALVRFDDGSTLKLPMDAEVPVG